ncbi:ABC transporter G family member 25-like [Macadamia integrifolia]|uniref:ABC transporter G family member 25-like n=1 Tax=Macadamia integrifolia TaxID=60698 RepID=UPI001C4E6B83|nr:ABC transporter G family member 25-like [Macadamia integrifolia]
MPMVGGRESPNERSPNGSEITKNCPYLESVMSSCYPITLKFFDICYRVKLESKNSSSSSVRRILGGPNGKGQTTGTSEERTILNGITGMVSPGEILAILGPSGSGKSTLLNALAGRLHGPGLTGTVLDNDQKLNKAIQRRTGYVTQDDVLYPHLTVRETLVFCSLLRLPDSLSKKEKIRVAESVLTELGLGKCENTIIGNNFIRGVSGGERKRVSIGHEMLLNPSLLLLDEPTSGLDSTGAHRLVSALGSLAQKGKTIVTSMHQPSSRVYQMFDSVLVLSEGRSIYYGKASDAMDYFRSIGFSPSFPVNPADFLVDLANGVFQPDGISETEKPNLKQTLISSYNNLIGPNVKAGCLDTSPIMTNGVKNRVAFESHGSKSPNKETQRSIHSGSSSSWFNQFTILVQRSLKERRHESFNSLKVFQVIVAAVLAGGMWWHSDIRDIQDRLGLLFFISIFWGVFPAFNSVFTFPQERAIFMKERSSGMYTLSSYFMARVVGDIPMELILPTVFTTIVYWMTGLKPELGAFLSTLTVLLGYVLVAQGLGLALGAIIMDAKQASTVVTVTMLAFVLTGGFYVHKVPACMAWIKYTSNTFYCYKLFIYIQYGEGRSIWFLLGCSQGSNRYSSSCRFVEEDLERQIHPIVSIGALVFMFVGYRLIAYAALRRIKV